MVNTITTHTHTSLRTAVDLTLDTLRMGSTSVTLIDESATMQYTKLLKETAICQFTVTE